MNLGAVPLDVYDSGNPGKLYIPSCAGTVRQCYQNALNIYYSQRRVTGVRFFFALCGGFYSTALTGCGGSVQFNSTWRTNFQQQEYNCAPRNDVNFVGWQNIYTVISNVLQVANSNNLNVAEVDLTNEMNLSDFTVQARRIVDNKRNNENVFGNLRNLMSQNGQVSGRVTYSVTGDNTSEAGCDCGSVYGDTARILHLSALTGGLGGGRIGLPLIGSDTSGAGARCAKLYCAIGPNNPDVSDMIGLPLSYTLPTIVDIHNSPCVLNSASAGCKDERVQGVQATEARLMFSGIKAFLDSFCPSGWRHNSPELCSALFMLGETGLFKPWPDPGSWWNCDQGVPRMVPAATVQGLNNSTLSGRTLAGGAAGVVFRPWTNPPAPVCFTLPEVLQPTFVPSP